MKLCFVSLSRKRFRYFSLVASRAPEDVECDVLKGGRLDLYWLRALFGGCDVPDDAVRIHLLRQQINYPFLGRIPLLVLLYRWAFRWWESARIRYFECVFADGGYDAVAVWNGQKPPYSAVVVAAQRAGLRLWFFENGVLPGSTTVDPCGVNAQSILAARPSIFQTRLASEPIQPNLPDGEISILIPLQLESDTQVVVHSRWVKSNRALVAAAVEAAQALVPRFKVKLVVRNHPLAKWDMRLREAPDSVVIDDVSALSEQLKAADIVVTINSTVGLEAVSLGKPVIVVGSALYGEEGVARPVQSVDELQRALSDVVNGVWAPVKAKSFARMLKAEYCIPQDWRTLTEDDDQHFEALWLRLREKDLFCHPASK